MVAMVLGGTVPHIELIQELKQRGYYVVLIDYYDNPPAKKYADYHIRESTLNQNKILEIAIELRADLIISACIDQANSICCYVAEKLGLPHPYSYKTSLQVTVKSQMKRIMVENNIDTPWFLAVKDVAKVKWDEINFPAVVKPVDCNSSKGVHKVNTVAEAHEALVKAISLSRRREALIESYIDGVEIQVDCLAENGNATVILTREKNHIQREAGKELNSEGSVVPAPICAGKEDLLVEIARKIATGFQLNNTPFFYQAIVHKNDHISVLEFAPRIGGGLSSYMLKNIVGFDAIRAIINSYLGVYNPPIIQKQKRIYSTHLLYMSEGVFGDVVGLEDAKKAGIIKEAFIFKEKGVLIDQSMRSGNRIGAFIVEAESAHELNHKAELAYSLIDIVDIHGKSKMLNRRKHNATSCPPTE